MKHGPNICHHSSWIVLFVILLVFVSSCEKRDSDETKCKANSVTSYCPKSGDAFEYRIRMETDYSDGQTITFVQKEKVEYSQTDAIPEKYSYSSDLLSSYIVDTTTVNGVVDSYRYMAIDGTVIIEDDLDKFSRIDAKTSSGRNEPADTSVGDEFVFHEESILFDSNTAGQIGTEVTNGTYMATKEESITVLAGTFHCLKIDFELEIIRQARGTINTLDTVGFIWYSIEKGFVLKMDGTTELTTSENDLTVITTFERVLTDYELGVTA